MSKYCLFIIFLFLTPSFAFAQNGLDLPITPPRFGDKQNPAPIPEPDDDDDEDPRDTPPPVFYGEEIDTESDSIIYVIDVSCSMGWDVQYHTAPDGSLVMAARIDRAKAELAKSISGLAENFKFNVVGYSCAIFQWRTELQEATPANKRSAIGWANVLVPAGSTGTGPATAFALGEKSNRSIVLLTDGAPNCGAEGEDGHRRMIRTANTQGAVINVFGISATGSYRAFCQGVAADSGGSFYDLP